MSVVKSKRGENELDVLTNSRKLAVYTIRICAKENIFPKRYRWCITNDIVKKVNVIHANIREANDIYVKDRSDYLLRRELQTIAKSKTESLLGDMDIAKELFGIDNDRMYHWTGLVIEVRTLLMNWKRSDEKRFSKMKDK